MAGDVAVLSCCTQGPPHWSNMHEYKRLAATCLPLPLASSRSSTASSRSSTEPVPHEVRLSTSLLPVHCGLAVVVGEPWLTALGSLCHLQILWGTQYNSCFWAQPCQASVKQGGIAAREPKAQGAAHSPGGSSTVQ